MIFYLGAERPSWLWNEAVDVPLCVSHATLRSYKTLHEALVPRWILDSGGFSEVKAHGAHAFAGGPGPYIEAVYRYRDEIGGMDWCAPQDWMCEPDMTERTGLTVREHQVLTVANFLDLRRMAPDLPFIPVIQGWAPADYLACVDLYADAGVDLTLERTVGVGSVCRRQHTAEIATVMRSLAELGLNLHGFGVKSAGIPAIYDHVVSADSMAWSFNARRDGHHRRQRGLPGSRFGCDHPTCNHCPRFALWWREKVLEAATAPYQRTLFA